jgi:putative heme-binding domain-containing protein
MLGIRICSLGAVAAALLAQPLLAQHGYTEGDIQNGGRIYGNTCISCHGPDGNRVAGTDLIHGKYRKPYTEEQLVQVIREGIPGTAMPAQPNISDFQAGAIVAYLQSLAKEEPLNALTGDPMRGQAIFEGKGNCLSCHRVLDKGSRVWPDLTDIGSSRRTVQLEKSIVDPDAEVLPQNRFVRVVTKSGSTVTGRILNEDTFTLQLMDTNQNLRSFEKSDLKEYTFLEKSQMPSYQGKLTPQEVADVASYLTTLKGVETQP